MNALEQYIKVELARRLAGDELREQGRAAEKKAVKAALAELKLSEQEYEQVKRYAAEVLAVSGPIVQDGYRFEAKETVAYVHRSDGQSFRFHTCESHKVRT